MAINNHPDLWEGNLPFNADANTIVVLSESPDGSRRFVGPENLVGFARYRPRKSPREDLDAYELSYLEVRKDHRGQGIGYAMLAEFFDRVVGYDGVVYVVYGSEDGKRFFERFINTPDVENELWEKEIYIEIEEELT